MPSGSYSVTDPKITKDRTICDAILRALYRYRKDRNYSRTTLCSLIGVAPIDMQRWETEPNAHPPTDVLVRWMEELGFTRLEWRDDGYNLVGDLYPTRDGIPEDISVRLFTPDRKRLTHVE